LALAHVVGNKTEEAYRRGDMFDRRRRLMDDWTEFCAAGQRETAKVVGLRTDLGLFEEGARMDITAPLLSHGPRRSPIVISLAVTVNSHIGAT
jgi:hypothetical protein